MNLVKRFRAYLFTETERMILAFACANHGSDVKRAGEDPEPSYRLARELMPKETKENDNGTK